VTAKPISTILIGSSLTEASDMVVRTGLSLARAAGARVAVAHAADLPELAAYGSITANGYGWFEPQDIDRHVSGQRARLAEQLTRLGAAADAVADTRVETGPADRLLLAMATELHADLIVVGATERGPVMRLLGSTADHVVRQASCPVLVVRDGLSVPPRKVLAPVDLSRPSSGALRWAGAFLDQLARGDRPPLEVLWVLVPVDYLASPFTADQMTRFAREELDSFVEQALHPLGSAETVAVRRGDPRAEIVAAATEASADLIVMATQGLRGLDRLLMGSVAAHVVQHASCSVLMVPPAAAEAAALAAVAAEFGSADWLYISDENPE
jgi:nucleotide-binding universal stress UspA family protein